MRNIIYKKKTVRRLRKVRGLLCGESDAAGQLSDRAGDIDTI